MVRLGVIDFLLFLGLQPLDTYNDNGKQKKSNRRIETSMKLNVLKYSTGCPFRWRRSTFMCLYCDQVHLDIASLREHTFSDHSDTTKAFSRSIRQLKFIKIEITNLRCTICGDFADDIVSIKNHLHNNHNKVSNLDDDDDFLPYKLNSDGFTCHICNKSFNRFLHLSNHFNEHYRNYICDICAAPFLNRSNFKQHLLKHGVGRIQCNSCQLSFISVSAKRRHAHIAHGNKSKLSCPYCPERFYDGNDKNKHMALKHNVKHEDCNCSFCTKPTLSSIKTKVDEKSFKCHECDKLFTKRSNLAKHILSHSSENSIRCQQCFKTYSSKRCLNLHMRIHNNDRRHVCQECGRAFIQKKTLLNHIRVHFVHKRL